MESKNFGIDSSEIKSPSEPVLIEERSAKHESTKPSEQKEEKVVMCTDVDKLKDKVQCKLCDQVKTEDVEIPSNAVIECVALTNEGLSNIYKDKLNFVHHNLTNYSIYDKNRHMCSIDLGIMERNVSLFMTGYLKPVYDDSPGIEKGIAAKELGPILEWWISSYDGGSHALIGISTEYADYLLIEPHLNYKKYMESVIVKIHLSKLVIERILDNQECDNPTYADILDYVIKCKNPMTDTKLTEEDLIAHAQFIVRQAIDYDLNDLNHLPLVDTHCIETLTQISGDGKLDLTLLKGLDRVRQRHRGIKTDISKREFSKATTTELVKDVFENMFAAQLENDNKINESNVQNLFKSVFDDICSTGIINKPNNVNIINNNQVIWNGFTLSKNMFVIVKDYSSDVPLIGRIEYFYKASFKDMAHITLFIHSFATILGEASDPQEIFALQKCMVINLNDVMKVLDVAQKVPSKDWFNLGGSKLQDLLEPVNRSDKKSFFYQQQYDEEFGRFEYIIPKILGNVRNKYCRNCKVDGMKKKSLTPKPLEFIEKKNEILYYYKFKLHNEEYKIGNFIYLCPGIFSIATRTNFIENPLFEHTKPNKTTCDQILKDVDEIKYPEYYRKTMENTMRGSNDTTPDPFEIAEILAIYTGTWNKNYVKLIVRRMYRSEQINLNDNDKNADMNMLYWSDETFRVEYKNIYGKCYVANITNIIEPLEWSASGPDRFYFIKKYNFLTGTLIPDYELPCAVKLTGKEVYVDYKYECVDEDKIQYIPNYKKIKPLRALDIFAGCGGLSKGLEDSGLIKCDWAIECDEDAAAAFELNNLKSTVFVEDCNHLLKLAMSGCKTNNKNQRIPQKGEVEFICGGPPCQGFSGMNRFNSGQYSLFKNSLIVSFLSYIDYYRPKYFVMENVRNLASFKRSMILKLTLRCITRMGYQCTFGILQAGNFGVPQTRRRLIIMAAAPGEHLPLFPEPIHVFNRRGSSLTVQVGDKKFKTNCKFDESAPMRTVTVYDAWSDLPEISNGACQEELPYKSNPITHLQKLLRYPNNGYSDSILTDHICKDMSHLVQARIELIPVNEGSDWRDLPNIEVKLCDGTMTNKLLYTHHDIKSGKSRDGSLRGVCQCASGEKCNPQDRQNNTIIPWCLPHTGNRHNNWAGLYGRLAWTGFCSTTITNPEPMGKQGRVLHPEQHRVVSVRECARSQGFKDTFLFYGPIINKHRQIGNAVPPPMGAAIGHEIIKAALKKYESANGIRPPIGT